MDRADHLCHVIHESGIMDLEIESRRANFVNDSVNMRDTFSFAHPLEKLEAVQKYCTSMYGSNL